MAYKPGLSNMHCYTVVVVCNCCLLQGLVQSKHENLLTHIKIKLPIHFLNNCVNLKTHEILCNMEYIYNYALAMALYGIGEEQYIPGW